MQEHNTANARLERNLKFKFFQYLAIKFRKDGLTAKEISGDIKKLTSLKKEEREKIEAMLTSTKLSTAPLANQEIHERFKMLLTKLQQASRMQETVDVYLVIADELKENDIEFLVDINCKLPLSRNNESKRDLFELLVKLDKLDLAKRVCRELYDINWQDDHGDTVLHRAFPNVKTMRLTLQIPGVNRDIKNKAGWSPLLLALRRAEELADFEPINLFIAKQKLKLDTAMNITLIKSAINKNCAKLAALVLSNGFEAYINHSISPEDKEHTPLWLACLRKSFAVADECIKFGAKLNTVEHLLFLAVEGKQFDVAVYLLKKGLRTAKNLPDGTTLFLAGHDNNQAEYTSALLVCGYKFKLADFLRILSMNDTGILNLMLSGEREEIILFYLCLLLTLMKHKYHPSLLTRSHPICEAFRLKIISSTRLNTLLTSKAYATITDSLRGLGLEALFENTFVEHAEILETNANIETKNKLIHEILAEISTIKADIHQIVSDFQLPKFMTEINEKTLFNFSVAKLSELNERVSEWGKKTFYRLSKAFENADDTLTPPPLNAAVPSPNSVCSFLGNPITDIEHIYPVENSPHYILLYDPTLIRNLNSISEEEKTRFVSSLKQLRFCQGKGAQGIKRLTTSAICSGTINGHNFTGEICYEIKLICFKHRILLTPIYPDEDSSNNTVILLACFLRHGNEHDRPLNTIYPIGDIHLPLKSSLALPAIDCAPKRFTP
jgi:ankyrin repeat protein